MAQYWMPPRGQPASVAPSLVSYRRGVGTGTEVHDWPAVNGAEPSTNGVEPTVNGSEPHCPPYPYSTVTEPGNPTVIPDDLLRQYHFTFLIRHPRSSVPSYFRCTVPPLSEFTGFDYFDPVEAGYKELRILFDYLVSKNHIGPKLAGKGDRSYHVSNGQMNGETNDHPHHDNIEICVVDADDLLDAPYAVIEAYCKSTGQKYSPDMLKWDDEESQHDAKKVFEKWKGFHEDALGSKELRPRTHVSV
jgi:hypothetical protein